MVVHKLNIDEFEADSFSLIAIYTNLEDFRLAYFINLVLNLNLKKNPIDILVNTSEGETNFTSFVFENLKQEISWNLFQNKSEISYSNKDLNLNLFSDFNIQTTKKVFILPEFKKVDFFLKIDHQEDINLVEIVKNINKIDRISSVNSIEISKIKNKNNLIF